MDLKRTIKNFEDLKKIKYTDTSEMYNGIVCCFDTSYNNIEVGYIETMEAFDGEDGCYQAYESNDADDNIIQFEIKDRQIVDVWEY